MTYWISTWPRSEALEWIRPQVCDRNPSPVRVLCPSEQVWDYGCPGGDVYGAEELYARDVGFVLRYKGVDIGSGDIGSGLHQASNRLPNVGLTGTSYSRTRLGRGNGHVVEIHMASRCISWSDHYEQVSFEMRSRSQRGTYPSHDSASIARTRLPLKGCIPLFTWRMIQG